MKKFLTIALALLLIVSAVACTKTNNENSENNADNGTAVVFENVDLTAIADSLYADIPEDNRPMVMSMLLDSEMFEAFAFIPYEEGIEAVVSEPAISSIAHSVVIVKASDAENAERIAAAMKENCNPRKWMCVEADIVEGVTNGNLAMLLMTTTQGGISDEILSAFNALTPENAPVASEEENTDIPEEDTIIDDETIGEEDIIIDVEDGNNVETDIVIDLGETPSENIGNVEPPVSDVNTGGVDIPAEIPEENVPAVMPEENVPAETPEENVPAVMPEENTPAEMPEANTPEVEAPASGNIDELYALADKLYTGIEPENMPMVGTMELNAENFEYSAFIPYKSSYLAVESMPMMGSQPHSVVIVEASSEEEAKNVASEMEANCNPRKWICVSAKAVKSAYKGNRAILIMTTVDVMPSDEIDEAKAEEESFRLSEERANIILNNFLANA